MSTWVLPWHYLSGTVALAEGLRLPRRDTLIERLLDIKDNQKLRDALAPDQEWDAPGGLFSYIRELSTDRSKPAYTWPDPTPQSPTANFTLKLRANFKRRDPILTPDALVLPWPFPGPRSKELEDALKQALDEVGAPGIPDLDDEDPDDDPERGLYLHTFMLAVDKAIAPDSTDRDEFCRHHKELCSKPNPSLSKRWVVEKAMALPGKPSSYPQHLLRVCVDENVKTQKTRWENDGTHLRIVMGWTQEPEDCPSSLWDDVLFFVRLVISIIRRQPLPGTLEIHVDKWPDGAYCGH